MKRMVIVLLCLASAGITKGQSTGEWIRQNEVQKKYLLQQIAAFQMYLGYVKTGYSIAKKGLHTIEDIKNGDLKLHDAFFKSLSAVNPRIRQYTRVADIISIQVSIARKVKEAISYCRDAKQLTDVELNYLQGVFDNVLRDCERNLNELVIVITDGEADMKDDERIRRIDKLYDEMQDKQVFVRAYGRSAKMLCMQRQSEGMDIEIGRKLQGLK